MATDVSWMGLDPKFLEEAPRFSTALPRSAGVRDVARVRLTVCVGEGGRPPPVVT